MFDQPIPQDPGHPFSVTQYPLAWILGELTETHRMRQRLLRAETALTLQIKSIERRVSGAGYELSPNHELPVAELASLPLIEARRQVHRGRLKPELRMKRIVREFPIHAWMKQINGFGEIGLAQILAEAGDLSDYSNPAKVWKRFGLAVIHGRAQGRRSGAAALEQGYSPQRRSIMHSIGAALIKKPNCYRDLYLARKEFERTKLPEASKMHIHLRAQRYMEKRLLRDLWAEWRR